MEWSVPEHKRKARKSCRRAKAVQQELIGARRRAGVVGRRDEARRIIPVHKRGFANAPHKLAY